MEEEKGEDLLKQRGWDNYHETEIVKLNRPITPSSSALPPHTPRDTKQKRNKSKARTTKPNKNSRNERHWAGSPLGTPDFCL